MKKVPTRVKIGSGLIRITGDGILKARTLALGWREPRADGWLTPYGWRGLLDRARRRRQELVIISGKKEKKFWRKVETRIEKLAPDPKPVGNGKPRRKKWSFKR